LLFHQTIYLNSAPEKKTNRPGEKNPTKRNAKIELRLISLSLLITCNSENRLGCNYNACNRAIFVVARCRSKFAFQKAEGVMYFPSIWFLRYTSKQKKLILWIFAFLIIIIKFYWFSVFSGFCLHVAGPKRISLNFNSSFKTVENNHVIPMAISFVISLLQIGVWHVTSQTWYCCGPVISSFTFWLWPKSKFLLTISYRIIYANYNIFLYLSLLRIIFS